jgi:3-oxoacyl-[acyl-carrier-protein] synthase II
VDRLGPGLHFERPVLDPGLGDIAAAVAREWCLGGPRLTVSAACASGIHALIRAAMMIRAGEVRQALVVATEASVHPLFLGSFQRLGVLAKPGAGCRPFDRGRDGFLMSEAAAAVLLEAADAENSQSSPAADIVLDRFALAGDATHLTGGDPDARTLRHLLARVIDGRPVDLVHAHGTGTPLNDEAELAAIESAVGPIDHAAPPSVYSHKGALGHSLGAAGLVSVVLNCQAHATGVVPPNVQTRDPLPTTRVTLSPAPVRRAVRRSVAVAAGFGGAMAAVSLVGGA